MTQLSIDKFRREAVKSQLNGSIADTKSGNVLLSLILNNYIDSIKLYLDKYNKGEAVRNTLAGDVIKQTGADTAGYISAKVILNSLKDNTAQSLYKMIGQALEDEVKMRSYRKENKYYYDTIQKDLNSRGAKLRRKKYITVNMFKKRLNFHLEKWSTTQKVQAGMILVNIFIKATGLVKYKTYYKGTRKLRRIEPEPVLRDMFENINNKLEALEPFFLPMVCKPKDWINPFEGGYLSPYLKRNKVIKNNNREYLNFLRTNMPDKVYEALNIIQSTAWQIDKEVLNTVKSLWEEGYALAGLPQRNDDEIPSFPYPEITKETILNSYQKEIISKWKREAYETYKKNVSQRSIRILTSQIIRIAEQFKGYTSIYFPYQMDFRGRIYPIPVLLHPQGSDLAKGLLKFAQGKALKDDKAREWFLIHGTNMFGFDKVSYKERIKWVEEHREEIIKSAKEPLLHRYWTEADKPFQFLSWCFEFYAYNSNPDDFISYIPVQLDGTCNGLQHYSALLRDEISGEAVNLINTDKPNDIYAKVAEKLMEKLKTVKDTPLGDLWLNLGINRKLTKRPVMVLPYGGSRLSCREYIEEYLRENYSTGFLHSYFKTGNNPTDCIYKTSLWLSNYLWEAIREVVKSAIVGMDYIKSLTREVLKQQNYLEWFNPLGLLIHQAYIKTKKKEIKTELFGKFIKTKYLINKEDEIDKQKQLNGICPNFIHSMDAGCLMLWLLKCREKGITSFMSVHDCYGVLAADTELSAKLLREAFVEVYRHPVLDNFEADLTEHITAENLPEKPEQGKLSIEEVMLSDYFFN